MIKYLYEYSLVEISSRVHAAGLVIMCLFFGEEVTCNRNIFNESSYFSDSRRIGATYPFGCYCSADLPLA